MSRSHAMGTVSLLTNDDGLGPDVEMSQAEVVKTKTAKYVNKVVEEVTGVVTVTSDYLKNSYTMMKSRLNTDGDSGDPMQDKALILSSLVTDTPALAISSVPAQVLMQHFIEYEGNPTKQSVMRLINESHYRTDNPAAIIGAPDVDRSTLKAFLSMTEGRFLRGEDAVSGQFTELIPEIHKLYDDFDTDTGDVIDELSEEMRELQHEQVGSPFPDTNYIPKSKVQYKLAVNNLIDMLKATDNGAFLTSLIRNIKDPMLRHIMLTDFGKSLIYELALPSGFKFKYDDGDRIGILAMRKPALQIVVNKLGMKISDIVNPNKAGMIHAYHLENYVMNYIKKHFRYNGRHIVPKLGLANTMYDTQLVSKLEFPIPSFTYYFLVLLMVGHKVWFGKYGSQFILDHVSEVKKSAERILISR